MRATNADGMSLRNKIAILQYVQRQEGATRAQVAKGVQLTQAAVSKISAQLLEAGALEEIGYVPGQKGRRSVGLRIKGDGRCVIGVRLSRRAYAIGAFTFSGDTLWETHQPFQAGADIYQVFAQIREQLRMLIGRFRQVAAIGVAVPGPYLQADGVVLLISNGREREIRNLSLRHELNERHFGGIPVITTHDANAAVLADWWFHLEGVLREKVVVHFLLGDGVGAGVLDNGAIFGGSQGMAGEVGHVSVAHDGKACHCGNRGCLELYCSSIAFLEDAELRRGADPASMLHQDALTVEFVFHCARAGDEAAIACVDRLGYFVGIGVVNLVNAYNPNVILLCNELARGGDMLLKKVLETAEARLLPRLFQAVEVRLSTFQGDDVLLGAGAVAIDYCLSRPEVLSQRHA